jgi:hypothetical protein
MQDDPPETIRTLAEGCARYVKQALGIELDGTPETLPILDHYLERARDDEARSRDEVLGLVATSAGAYLGEVIRRAQPHARWHVGDVAEPSTWRIELDHVFLAFNPVGMAREAILEHEEEGWNAHLEVLPQDREVLSQSLERVGAVSDEDYWRLAVRWEVVEQAIAVLEGAALARGDEARRWSAAIYARALDDEPGGSAPS